MKGKKVRILSWLLLLSVVVAEVCGNGTAVYAAQSGQTQEQEPGTGSGPAAFATPDEAQPEASEAELAFAGLLQENAMYGTLANAANISVYQEPSLSAPVVRTLPSGYQIRFIKAAAEADGLWYQVAFGMGSREHTGYVQEAFIVTQDERFAEWKSRYFGGGRARNGAGVNAAGNTDLSAFPSSYRSKIKKLVTAHPNWTFVPMNTGLKWSDVIANETVDKRNLVSVEAPVTWKALDEKSYNMSTGKWIIKDGSSWVQASESIVKYYMDPRNFLNEDNVFMFEQLTYNKSSHTEAGVEKILEGTFMSRKKLEDGSGGNITYAKAFMKIGKELNVSPYFLASRVRQEQGVAGTSGLISGKYPGYKGYYNYFNIMATGIGDQTVVVNGLKEAKKAGWTTRYASLRGGAQKTANNYIARGQDTHYLQKFDVDASYDGLYWHQYMQNVSAAYTESQRPKKSYTEMGALNNSFVFKVPVYTSMPSSVCPDPGDSLKKPSLTAAKQELGVVKLSWKEIGGAQAYQVYRREGEDGKFKKIKTMKGLTKTSFRDKTALPGKIYSYRVRAYLKVKEGTKYSSYSAVKQADCTVSAAALKKCTAVDSKTVKLTWTKAEGVTGYRIYRKTTGGKYARIKTIKKGSTSSYKDTTVQKGQTYTYRIRAYLEYNGAKYTSAYCKGKKVTVQ